MKVAAAGLQRVIGIVALLTYATVAVAQNRDPADVPFVVVFVDAKTEADSVRSLLIARYWRQLYGDPTNWEPGAWP